MLTELNVSQFAIIENLQLHFHEGLNILSGETGAGKSVLLKSLALLMGAKSSSDMIRTGAKQAFVEGHFDLEQRQDIQNRLADLDIPLEDSILIVRRVIGPNDKNKVYLNGTLSTVTVLKEIVAPMIEVTGRTIPLIEMTGQHENKNLLNKSYQLDLLDHSAGIWPLRKNYEKKWSEWKQLNESIQKKQSDIPQLQQKLDFLIYQKNEIAQLDLAPGEEVELEAQIKKLKNMQKLCYFVDSAEENLINSEDSALQRIQKVLQRGHDLQNVDSTLKEKVESLEQAKIIIEESIYELRSYVDKINDESSDLESLEVKLSLFRKLQKKYGSSVDDILNQLKKIETEINQLQNIEVDLQEMQKKEKELLLQLKQWAEDLHLKRDKNSKKLETAVNNELKDLNMKGCRFEVSIAKENQLSSHGNSLVEFMSQTSPKDPPRSLSKIASGGELSRILLALKCVTGTSTLPRTYLFDEVDTGVSGPTAQKVGLKLHQIAQGQQVMCVTHLPQVAAFADYHFLIQKDPTAQNSMAMSVSELKKADRIKELARLISGEKITTTSLAHAKELLKLHPTL